MFFKNETAGRCYFSPLPQPWWEQAQTTYVYLANTTQTAPMFSYVSAPFNPPHSATISPKWLMNPSVRLPGSFTSITIRLISSYFHKRLFERLIADTVLGPVGTQCADSTLSSAPLPSEGKKQVNRPGQRAPANSGKGTRR